MTPKEWMSHVMNVKTDFTMFDAYAQVLEDIAMCHFEAAFIDIEDFCTDEANDCSVSAAMGNAKDNMFPLIGKVTEIGQELDGFPSDDNSEFKMEMKMIGDGFGSSIRLILDFHE